MAAQDRIRLTSSLRKGPRKGALLFGAAEDPGLAGLGPLVLDAVEPPKAPAAEQLEGLRVARPAGVIEQQQSAGSHLLHRGFERVDPRHRRGLEEVDDNQIERIVRQRCDLLRKRLHVPQPEIDVRQPSLLQPLPGPRIPVLVVLEAEDGSCPSSEPNGRAPGAELQNAPIRSHPPPEPADRRRHDPWPLRGLAPPGAPPRRRVMKPSGDAHRPACGVKTPGPLAGIVRPPQCFGGHLPDSTLFLKARWRRSASRMSRGVRRSESFGCRSKKRANWPRQLGIARTGFGLSIRATARSATSSGISITPEKERASLGSSSLSLIIGVQTPSGQTHETWIPPSPSRRRSAAMPRLKAMAACLLAE